MFPRLRNPNLRDDPKKYGKKSVKEKYRKWEKATIEELHKHFKFLRFSTVDKVKKNAELVEILEEISCPLSPCIQKCTVNLQRLKRAELLASWTTDQAHS